MSSRQAESNLTPIQSGICGANAGLISRLIIAPLDVIKIRLQLDSHKRFRVFSKPEANRREPGYGSSRSKYTSMSQTFRTIMAEEGIFGFWKGNLAAEYLYLTYGALQFLTYKGVEQILSNLNENSPIHIPRASHTFFAGATAGVVATIGTYPLDLMRTRFAAQGGNKIYTSFTGAFSQIYRSEGLPGFYRGMWSAIIQIMPYMGLMFGSYDLLKRQFQALKERSRLIQQIESGEDFLCGGLAGVISKTGVFPFDLVRKRLQIQGPNRTKYIIDTIPQYNGGVLACIRQILYTEGFLGLYKGLLPGLLKAAPGSAITFFIFGETARILKYIEKKIE
ncbi:mitochondrial thiamine pyrophosphate carrier 1 [Basidiobolus meristosporus CBS 931.73]|uniref:Mitochondrial thiamine pyrophosphate carrier 1 n=1 Tax=Basidiobolus meristosporus CBS 931.73 TaxID=1314790 RepID=A0A1Y1YEU0_9FUNG|nr:mitochondrial thiamine pyrophosphate carrier 1 [Basidiobolus meristosporus CBS 931.73]|eukprot:ORX96475.1 mitochondrial thiamine pyrophosphate carrier 1 [Basidiobolus meristosporus CBS 931.73]